MSGTHFALAIAILLVVTVCRGSEAPATEAHETPPLESGAEGRVATTAPGERQVRPFEGVVVFLDSSDESRSRVELTGMTCLDSGWLEQVACTPATREHESLIVVTARPSQIHAALLMAGFESGAPGRWVYENDKFDIVSPTGEKLDIWVRYAGADGRFIEHEIGKWIREAATQPNLPSKPFPRKPFVFGGSQTEAHPSSAPATTQPKAAQETASPSTAPSERHKADFYVADASGSVIGLVTFGDEVIGFSVVRSDQEAVQEPTWEANPETLPDIATPVTLIIRRWKDHGGDPS